MDAGGRATQGAVAEGQGEGNVFLRNAIEVPLTPTLSRGEERAGCGSHSSSVGDFSGNLRSPIS